MSIDTIRRICGRRQCLWAAARELTGRRTAAASEPEWLGWDAWVQSPQSGASGRVKH